VKRNPDDGLKNSLAIVAWQIEKNLPAVERVYRTATGFRSRSNVANGNLR